MIIDIVLAVIIIACIFIGDRKGFLLSLISTFGWVMSVCGAYVFQKPFLELIDEKTTIRENVMTKVTDYLTNKLMADAMGADSNGVISGSVASILRAAAEKAVAAAANAAAVPIVDAIMGLLAFLLLAILIKVAMFLVEQIVKLITDDGNSVIGELDSMVGMIFGLIKGCIIGYLLLMLLSAVAITGNIEPLLLQLQDSFVMTTLNNIGFLPFSMDGLNEAAEAAAADATAASIQAAADAAAASA